MRSFGLLAAALLTGAVIGCGAIAGLGDFEDATTASGSGGGTGGGGSSGTGGGAGDGGTGGVGGVGGSPAPTAEYSVSFGSLGADTMGGVGTDANGDVYFAGIHFGAITIADEHDDGNNSPFVAKLDGYLAPEWSLSFAVTTGPTVRHLATGPNGLTTFVGEIDCPVDFGAGTLTPLGGASDAYAARFADGPTHDFSAIYGDNGTQVAYGVDAAGAGFVVGGFFLSTIDLGDGALTANETDGFVARFDFNNNLMWAVQIGGAETQEVRAVAYDEVDSRIYVAGIFNEDGEVNGTTLVHGGTGTVDAFVLVFDDTVTNGGTLLGHTVMDGMGTITPRAIDYFGQEVVVAGSFDDGLHVVGSPPDLSADGGSDGFVVKLNDDLTAGIWSLALGGTGSDAVRDVATDASGNIAAVGGFTGTADFGAGPRTAANRDVFVVKLNSAGSHVWSGTYGGAQDDTAVKVAINPNEHIIVAGEFDTQIDFGNDVLTTAGGTDLFLAKFSPWGE